MVGKGVVSFLQGRSWSLIGSRAGEVLSPAGQGPQQPMPAQCGAALWWGSSAVAPVVWSLPQLCP